MAEKRWAEIDDDWRRKEERAMAQRAANAAADREGNPLPFPNPWDEADPTKLRPEEASEEAALRRYREFCKICPPFKPKPLTV